METITAIASTYSNEATFNTALATVHMVSLMMAIINYPRC